ncbi:Mor transcription activator family protein [Vibrio parahaemolyticus]|nr:positive regulator of late transcription [Vibrio parahaemolyticus]
MKRCDETYDIFGYDDVTMDDIQKLLPTDSDIDSRWPELMLTVFNALKDELSKLNLNDEYALILLARLCKDTGGLQYYFPKGDALEHQLKRMHIWRDFNGNNVPELSRRYGISTQNVYAAIRQMRASEVKARQIGLF